MEQMLSQNGSGYETISLNGDPITESTLTPGQEMEVGFPAIGELARFDCKKLQNAAQIEVRVKVTDKGTREVVYNEPIYSKSFPIEQQASGTIGRQRTPIKGGVLLNHGVLLVDRFMKEFSFAFTVKNAVTKGNVTFTLSGWIR